MQTLNLLTLEAVLEDAGYVLIISVQHDLTEDIATRSRDSNAYWCYGAGR